MDPIHPAEPKFEAIHNAPAHPKHTTNLTHTGRGSSFFSYGHRYTLVLPSSAFVLRFSRIQGGKCVAARISARSGWVVNGSICSHVCSSSRHVAFLLLFRGMSSASILLNPMIGYANWLPSGLGTRRHSASSAPVGSDVADPACSPLQDRRILLAAMLLMARLYSAR